MAQIFILPGSSVAPPPQPPFGHQLPMRGEGDGGSRVISSIGPPPVAPPSQGEERPLRVAILSFLFNWPSTGGGDHHTAELAAFLARAGYHVKHFFAQFPSWGIGRITDALISPSEATVEIDKSIYLGWSERRRWAFGRDRTCGSGVDSHMGRRPEKNGGTVAAVAWPNWPTRRRGGQEGCARYSVAKT